MAYHGLVASILRYGLIFWGNCSDRETIFKAQKRCIRSMTGLKMTDSCVPVFKSLKLLTLPSLYILEIALFVKSNQHLFTKVSQTRKRSIKVRSQYRNMLNLGRYHTALLRKSVMGMGPAIYNKIPDEIKELNSYKFKKKLTSILLEKCYYSITDFLNDKF